MMLPFSEADKRHLTNVVKSSLGDMAQLGGEVFSSGIDTLQRGPLYILGLNPGGNSASYLKISEHVARWDLERYSAFVDQCWNQECWNLDSFGRQKALEQCSCIRGRHRHQRAVRTIVDCMIPGIDIRSVFATNAIFLASKEAKAFRDKTGYSLKVAREKCWEVHRYLLARVLPKVILCLGYGEYDSAFSLLKGESKPALPTQTHRRDFKWFEGEFSVDGTVLCPLVVGVFHPSYGDRIKDKEILRALVAQHVGSNRTPHADAREAPCLVGTSSARAGGLGR